MPKQPTAKKAETPAKKPTPTRAGANTSASKSAPAKAAPGKAPPKAGSGRPGAGRVAPSKAAPSKAAPSRVPQAKSAPGKSSQVRSAPAKPGGGKAAPTPVSAGKLASEKPGQSKAGPSKASQGKASQGKASQGKVVAESSPTTKPANKPSAAGGAPGRSASRSAPVSSAPSRPRPGGPIGGGTTAGGRPIHARPRLPKGDLGGDEKIVLVPARTSDTARPKGAPAPARGGKASGERVVLGSSAARAAATVVTPVLPLPVRKRDEPMTLEERAESIERRLAAQTDEFRQRYWDTFYMSWIYHDSALEGVVYTFDELRAALGGAGVAPPPPPPPGEEGSAESNIQPACEEIRRHREAIDYIRDYAKKKGPITIDVIRKIFLILHPEEGDLKSVKYRRDIPQHRLYFHEYEQPDKIAHKVRGVVDWLNDPETKKGRNGLRIAARAHYDLLRVFPFQSDSGKVSRLFMNLLLLRAGLPPSIIHSAERQRYYDALKGSTNQILTMVQESVEIALLSIEKLLDEHESKTTRASAS